VTKEKFLDMRDPENRAEVYIKETKYPRCTNNGTRKCSLAARAALRGTKTNLTESTIKRLNPKATVGPSPPAKKIVTKLADGILDLMRKASSGDVTTPGGSKKPNLNMLVQGMQQQAEEPAPGKLDTHDDASFVGQRKNRPQTAIARHHARLGSAQNEPV
jgi:hypothetical protein